MNKIAKKGLYTQFIDLFIIFAKFYGYNRKTFKKWFFYVYILYNKIKYLSSSEKLNAIL